MKKHQPLVKPVALKLRREHVRSLEQQQLLTVAGAVSGSGMPIGRRCGPGVSLQDTCWC